jgi:hypothetical protein
VVVAYFRVGVISQYLLDGLRKIIRNLRMVFLHTEDIKSASAEYKAGIPTARQILSVGMT